MHLLFQLCVKVGAYVVEPIFTAMRAPSGNNASIPKSEISDSEIEILQVSYRGSHTFADYRGLIGNEFEIATFVFELMRRTIHTRTSMKIVHDNLCILNENTPPGFTAILQLDESHFSALGNFTSHAYTSSADKGLLCVDLFSCGSTNTEATVQFFEAELKRKYPSLERLSLQTHRRFAGDHPSKA